MTTFVDTVAYIATRDESLRKVTITNKTPSNLPVLNKTPSGRTKLIKALEQYTVNTNCPYAPLPSPTHIPTAFCKDTCLKYCPNHYTAFRPIPLKITRDSDSQRIVNAIGVPKHTPLFEASGIIYKTPTSNTFKITSCNHSSVLSTHPAVLHMIQDTSPNCVIRPLLIPEPTPQLKLFVITLYDIPPYTTLTVRPPPLPLPPPQPPPEPPPSLEPARLQNERPKLRITDYFRSANRC